MSTRWPEVSLDEILTPRQEKPSEEDLLSGRVRIVSKISFADGRIDFRPDGQTKTGMILVRPGDLLVSGINAYKGAIAIYDPKAEKPAAATIHYSAYAIRSDHGDSRFLWYLLRSNVFRHNLERAVPGGIKSELKPSRLLRVPVPLPPLAEQRRLVARIEQLAAQVHEARALRQQATKEAVVLDTSLLAHLIPWDAPKRTLGELIDPGSTISYGVLVPGPDIDGGVPFVRVQDLDLRNPPARPHKGIAPDVEAQYARTRLHGGEILVGVVGSIGKIGIAPPSWAGANVARAVCRIVPGPEIDRYYLAMALHSPRTQDYFRETTRTLAQPTLNVAQLEQTPIPVPQMPEQRRIAKRLEDLHGKLDKLKRVQSETAVELDALLPSILDKAFKGEL